MILVVFYVVNDIIGVIDKEKLVNDNALVIVVIMVIGPQLLVDFRSMAVNFDSCPKEFPIFRFLKRFSQREEQQRRLRFHLNIA